MTLQMENYIPDLMHLVKTNIVYNYLQPMTIRYICKKSNLNLGLGFHSIYVTIRMQILKKNPLKYKVKSRNLNILYIKTYGLSFMPENL